MAESAAEKPVFCAADRPGRIRHSTPVIWIGGLLSAARISNHLRLEHAAINLNVYKQLFVAKG